MDTTMLTTLDRTLDDTVLDLMAERISASRGQTVRLTRALVPGIVGALVDALSDDARRDELLARLERDDHAMVVDDLAEILSKRHGTKPTEGAVDTANQLLAGQKPPIPAANGDRLVDEILGARSDDIVQRAVSESGSDRAAAKDALRMLTVLVLSCLAKTQGGDAQGALTSLREDRDRLKGEAGGRWMTDG